jgi:hypothetical protein
VTVIAAIWESEDAVLIAADSGQTETPGNIRTIWLDKLQAHDSAPLAWGVSGSLTVGVDAFAQWLRTYPWPPPDLPTFQKDVANQLAQCNAKQRCRCQMAGVEAQSNDLVEVLIAGYWMTPFIFAVDDRGAITACNRAQEFEAIGSGAAHVKIAHITLSRIPVQAPSVVNKLGYVMQIAATTAQMCDLPIHIWRIANDGVKKLDATAPKSQGEG